MAVLLDRIAPKPRHHLDGLIFAIIALTVGFASHGQTVEVWSSSEDGQLALAPGKSLEFKRSRASSEIVVEVDTGQRYQTMLGMGSSLEHTTCYNLSQLDETALEEVIRRLVDPGAGIGMNLMRICIGTPDFTGEPWYSYDDVPKGETDPNLARFSIERDRAYVLPILKAVLRANPDVLFYASPWSPPGWMKSTGNMIGGRLLPEHYSVYAQYFVRFVQAYAAEGIPVHAITIQNEPGVDRSKETDPKWFYPSCRWKPEEERNFIRDHLGPAFEANGLKTEIWAYDHNFNDAPTPDGDDPGIAYPRVVMSDPQAAKYVDGVAFHGYAGRPAGMTTFHGEFPGIPLYFTEGSAFGTRGALTIVGHLRNWARSYNAWVTMIDENGKPNNGPFEASRTNVMLNSTGLDVTYNFDHFMYGQFMKFVQRGAERVESSEGTRAVANIAFLNPDGSLVLVLVNNSPDEAGVSVKWNNLAINLVVTPKSVSTLRWRSAQQE